MEFDRRRYRVYDIRHPAIWHWILNPIVAINELLCGQRVPKVMLLDRMGDKPIIDRLYVPCPHCETLNASRIWSFGNAFGHWFGYVCPACGERIPCLRNVFSLLLLALTLPLWIIPVRRMRQRWLAYERERMAVAAARALGPQKKVRWLMVGTFGFGGSMFVVCGLVFTIAAGGVHGFSLSMLDDWLGTMALLLPLCLVGGFIGGAIMKLFMDRKGRTPPPEDAEPPSEEAIEAALQASRRSDAWSYAGHLVNLVFIFGFLTWAGYTLADHYRPKPYNVSTAGRYDRETEDGHHQEATFFKRRGSQEPEVGYVLEWGLPYAVTSRRSGAGGNEKGAYSYAAFRPNEDAPKVRIDYEIPHATWRPKPSHAGSTLRIWSPASYTKWEADVPRAEDFDLSEYVRKGALGMKDETRPPDWEFDLEKGRLIVMSENDAGELQFEQRELPEETARRIVQEYEEEHAERFGGDL